MAQSKGKTRTAVPYVPAAKSLRVLREAVQGCRGCDLYKEATQAVFGEGPRSALLMLVGEVPGDEEDKTGRVFVGPSGRMLDRALEEVGVPRAKVYVTNAVKHFKFKRRGKRRIHDKPDASEIRACRPWLESEFDLVKPRMLVALGATAAKALFGSSFGVMKERGRAFESKWAPWSMATVHPSALLRAPDKAARAKAWAEFLADFRIVGKQYAREAAKLHGATR
jgi:uracil-DNA glycosylase family protein